MKNGMRYLFFILILLLTFNTAYAEQAPKVLELEAKSAVLMDVQSGEVLYSENPGEHLQIASVTKIMTMLLIMEAIDTGKITMDEIVTASEYACSMGGSQVYLEPGEQMSVAEMLKAIAVASGNDASVAMAEHILGSAPAFVNAMNTRAKALGMKDTVFINCTGLDGENQYSSAHDVALMSRELLKHDKIIPYLTIWMDTLRDGKFGLANTNKLVRFYSGCIGIKTGSTSQALYCLSAAANKNDLTLIAVVLGAPSSTVRFNNASKLLDYGFANYSMATGASKGDSYGSVNVSKGRAQQVEVTAGADLKKLVSKDKKGKAEVTPVLPDAVIAPVAENQQVGELILTIDGQEVARVSLVAKQSVQRINAWHMFMNVMKKWTMI